MREAVAAVLAAAGVGVGARLCVALSGGVDSTVLLHALAGERKRLGFGLMAAHVHHGLSPEADRWRASCAEFCAALEVPFSCSEVVVPRDDPRGLEAAARAARHAALGRVDADWLVFGHHQDDQAETLLFRLLRGTGLRGAGAMTAIEPGRPGRLRPLLGLRRADIAAYARDRSLVWVEDESNADTRFARNRLRHDILPAIERDWPGAVPALARAADHFREAEGLLDALARIDLAACGGAAGLRREPLLALADERLFNLLRHLVRAAGAQAPTRTRLHEAVRQMRAAGGAPLHLPLGQVACCVYRGRVWLESLDTVALKPAPWRGEPALAWGGGRVRFEPAVGEGIARAAIETAAEVALVPRREGLALRRGPARPEKSLRKLCQEEGIPAWLRSRLPVLEIDGRAAWIGEIGVAAEFVCPPGAVGFRPVWERA